MKYRHGDLLVHTTERPEGRLIKQYHDDPRDVVLLAGEATGHNHRLQGDFALYATNNTGEESLGFFEVTGKANLNHEEHGIIDLPKGFYAIVRQREYTPKGIEYVRD
jgi:hypothetical protein